MSALSISFSDNASVEPLSGGTLIGKGARGDVLDSALRPGRGIDGLQRALSISGSRNLQSATLARGGSTDRHAYAGRYVVYIHYILA